MVYAEQKEEYRQNFAQWEQDQYDVTIGELLLKTFPSLFTSRQQGGVKVVGRSKSFTILCHGMVLDLATPLYWLQLNMSYMDNFIYISLYSYTD